MNEPNWNHGVDQEVPPNRVFWLQRRVVDGDYINFEFINIGWYDDFHGLDDNVDLGSILNWVVA